MDGSGLAGGADPGAGLELASLLGPDDLAGRAEVPGGLVLPSTSPVTPGVAASNAFLNGSVRSFENDVTMVILPAGVCETLL